MGLEQPYKINKIKLLGSEKVENILLEALKTSSIDFNIDSDEKYQYELIANGEEKIVTRLRKYFEDCDEFIISVAFITMGGISLFLEELKNLENKEKVEPTDEEVEKMVDDFSGKYLEKEEIVNEKDDKKVSQTLNQEVDLSFLTGNKVKTRDIIIFLQNLLVLKEANFNNIDALNMIIKSTESKTLKNIIRETLAGIESGEYMYETMEKYPKIFPFIVTNIIKVGELSRNNG